MGKNGAKKVKSVQESTQEKPAFTNNDAGNSKHQASTELDELAERLRRLERTNSGGNSDVYKFVLFFVMGVAMTILLYPHVTKTVETFNLDPHSSNSRSSRNAETESFMDVGEKTDVGNIVEHNKTARETNPMHAEFTEPLKGDNTMIKTDKPEISVLERNTNEQTENREVEDDSKVEEVDEDPLIGEVLDQGETFKQTENAVKDHIPTDRVDLFNMDGDVGELPIKFVNENENVETNQEQPSRRQSERKVNKKKPSKKESGKKRSKKDSKKKTKKEEDTGVDVQNNSPDIPPEIRDFKPIYQKTLQPKKIFADGRRIPPTELLPQKPNNSSVKVWMFEEFLSEAECDGLMRVHKQHVEDQSKTSPILCFDSIGTLRKHLENAGKQHVRVTPRDFTEGTTCANASFSGQLKTWLKGNWSYSTAFYPGESRFASIFEQRVQQAMGLKPESGGKFQITSYPLGIGYKSHTDCVENSSDKRDRVATVLVYLDTVSEGGETDFPELGIWVRPRKARALLWNNMNEDGECEPLSIHQAKQVISGHKVILQRWYYYKSFYSLGKRPPEPPLPRREPGQPRVSCDEYEHGSCRWYDEWNFEHMLEYERQKYNLV